MYLKRIFAILILGLSVFSLYPWADASPNEEMEQMIIHETQSLIPLSIQMIDYAIELLNKEPFQMNPRDHKIFNDIFDPGETGCIDQAYRIDVRNNYIRIQEHFMKHMTFGYAAHSEECRGMRLYYTNFIMIHVCPYFLEEDSVERKARNLIHEVAHLELLALDRSYYDPKSYSARYHDLMPRGTAYTKIPVIGHIIREIQRSDTLYHPDAYAWFAGLTFEMASEP
jgi:hypothetical protein